MPIESAEKRRIDSRQAPAGQRIAPAAAPLYERVKGWIKARIDGGEWAPGARIPSENEIVRLLGVSRMTVNRALRELASEGLLARVAGVGSFVAERRPPSPMMELKSIADEIAARGGRHRAVVLSHTRERAPAAIARAMALAPRTPLFHSLLLHYDGALPLQLEDRWVNPAVAPDYLAQDFTAETPNHYLVRTVPFTEAEHTIEAAPAVARSRELLALADGEPVLVLHRCTWLDEQAVTRVTFTHPSSRYRFGGRFRRGN